MIEVSCLEQVDQQLERAAVDVVTFAEAGAIVSQPLPLRTRSMWGPTHRRIYNYLDLLEASGLERSLCVVGSSDGAEVLPAAKRGFQVRAIDIDPVALRGGAVRINEQEFSVKGLQHWLEIDGTSENVEVIERDFMDIVSDRLFTGVFASGVIHYETNMKYTPENMIRKLQSFVAIGGIILIEYIHPSEDANNDPTRYYLTASQIAQWFQNPDWYIRSNKVKAYADTPNPRNPRHHTTTWGKLYATKIADNTT